MSWTDDAAEEGRRGDENRRGDAGKDWGSTLRSKALFPSPRPRVSPSPCPRVTAFGLAPMPMAIRLLTPVRVQTICQRSRAAGVLVFHHVGQPMPDAVVGACEALGTRRARGSRAPRRAPPYYRRRSASRANRCDDVVSPGQHVVSAPLRRTPPLGLPSLPRSANSFYVNNFRACSGQVFPLGMERA